MSRQVNNRGRGFPGFMGIFIPPWQRSCRDSAACEGCPLGVPDHPPYSPLTYLRMQSMKQAACPPAVYSSSRHHVCEPSSFTLHRSLSIPRVSKLYPCMGSNSHPASTVYTAFLTFQNLTRLQQVSQTQGLASNDAAKRMCDAFAHTSLYRHESRAWRSVCSLRIFRGTRRHQHPLKPSKLARSTVS